MEENKTAGCSCNDSSSCTQQNDQACPKNKEWVTGYIQTPVGEVKQVSTTLSFKDTLGSWKARWGINRMNYKIDPGLYCVGKPDGLSPVLVSANYKMSFDRLRKELTGLDAWILVIDTKGINVWCAAGKGTFGTDEIISRIQKTGLSKVVSNRILILPQLGSPGVAAHEVQKLTGFKVVYGPVRAEDIKVFLRNGMKATAEMRTVKFTLVDRLVLTPMELRNALKPSIIVFGILFVLNSIGLGDYGLKEILGYLGAVLTGCLITPVLLPLIPGRAFAFKGGLLGLIWALIFVLANGGFDFSSYKLLGSLSYILIIPVISAYGAMNFTGSSTYTSPSGVRREMKIAIPLMIISTALGVALLMAQSIARLLN